MHQVYVIVNKMNGKMYVGSTKVKLSTRFNRHLIKVNQGSNNSIHRAIRKYGKENFDIRMIEEYSSKETMLQGEIELIAYFDTYKSKYGYNDTLGGEGGNTNGGKKFSEEWKLEMSKSSAGVVKTSRRRFSDKIEQAICGLYVEENKSTYALGNQFDCPRTTISDILRRNDVKLRQSNYTGHSNGKNIFSLEQEMKICELYQNGDISRSELARQFGCGKTTIRDILLRNNIKL
jgi:group I intron endonuclease